MNVKWTRALGATTALAISCLVAAQIAQARPLAGAAVTAAPVTSGCALGANGSPIKHVIYLQFDNVHYRRDAAGVPSDLEQMPHLLNFLKGNGTLLTNDHTVLISHTAGGILSSLTGEYPDRSGPTVSNSYGFFKPDGTVGFSSTFKYWTDPVDATLDPLPNMITDGQKTTPAPWVPFTRAGCDVGGVGTANIELENTSTSASGDMTHVFGSGSPEWNEAAAAAALPSTPANAQAKGQPQTDFVGIAVHCGTSSTSVCASNPNARADTLPDEPGGYAGFQALFGAKYVDPAITAGQACVNDTAGQPIMDPAGTCGFPGFDGMLARNTLGYVAQMQENGVPVTYGYISDAHDAHVPNPLTDSYQSTANGPGEAAHEAQLKAYDDAFAAFFSNLAAHGIDKSNTLFAITVDEGDHFAGGAGIPQPDGTLAYARTACATLTACPSNQIGEVNLKIQPVLPAGTPIFSIHRDSSPAFWVNGQPGRTNPTLRKLERDVAGLNAIDPYVSSSPAPVFLQLADSVGEKALHMVNTDPARTPSFTAFGNPDYFVTDGSLSCGSNPCIDYHFAWSHGDIQSEIATNWLGLVGPGVTNQGIDSKTWTDHTNVRSTMLALAGLRDSYVNDGRVLIEAIETKALPQSLIAHRATLLRLGDAYEQVNAAFGQFGLDLLTASTRALKSTNETQYESIETSIASLASQRDALASQIKVALSRAAFDGQALNEQQAKDWIAQAQSLLDQARALAG
jgi:hypothetical protein